MDEKTKLIERDTFVSSFVGARPYRYNLQFLRTLFGSRPLNSRSVNHSAPNQRVIILHGKLPL